jgi:16S rRNA (cytosine967-C5)-methyltransferase
VAKSRRKPKTAPNVLQNSLVSLWHKIAANPQPPAIDRFLARELSKLDGMSRKDRLWLGDILTDALRFGALTLFCESWRREGWQAADTAAAHLAQHNQPMGPELWRRLSRLPAPIVFFWTFMRKRLTGAELPAVSAPGPDANEVWRTVRHECPASEVLALRSLWAGLPPGMIPQLENRIAASGWSNQDALTFLDQHAARPPVWLRLLRPDVAETLREELATAQFSSREAGLAWSVKGVGGIFELPSYRAGNFDIQDFASQGIGDAVKARPGELIWDCCAGAGGKSLQLAASMAGEGTVTASDLHEGKLKDLRRRAERAGLANIQASVWDGKSVPDFSDAVKAQGGFDAVLVDAPCSGSGTWRRNVDGRLRLVPADLARWTEVQDFLLELVAEAVRPKGRLVYATCSWLTAENEQVIDAFLAKNPSWQLISQALAGNPQANSDTTFWAVMQRRQK